MTRRTWCSERLGDGTQSYIRRMTRECDRVGGVNLGQGICDLPTPAAILEETARAVLDDCSVYTKFEGLDCLREQIAHKLAVYNGISGVDAEREIVVTVGSAGAFASTVHALLDPGDEVIILEPYYGYHVNTLRLAQLVPVVVPMIPPNWDLDMELLEQAAGPRTRAIVINTPGNPSGKVFTVAELRALASFCDRHDLLVITDEIYEYIVYDRPHVSPASLPELRSRTVTLSGFSKTFSITGWRLGYAMAPAELAHRIGLVNDLMYICAPAPLQKGLAMGMTRLPEDYYVSLAADYRRKRDQLCGVLSTAGLPPSIPDGAYYVLTDITALGKKDDLDAAMHILHRVGVAGVPGRAFFNEGRGVNFVRFCFAKAWDILVQACERLEKL